MINSRKFALSAAIVAALGAGAIATGPLLVSEAAAQPKKARACFFPRDVQSWSSGEKDTVNFRVGLKRYFQGELATSCPDIDWSLRVGFDTRGSISVCEGQEATLIVPSSTLGPQRCMVTHIRELSPTEVAALPKKSKP